eukprot:gene8267-8455_t
MDAVAARKLQEAHVYYHELQKKLESINPSSEAYHNLMKELAALLPLVEGYQQLQQIQAEESDLQDLVQHEKDQELRSMAVEELGQLQQQAATLRESLLLQLLPPDNNEHADVVLEIRSSVGGEWAGDFAADLLEMYRQFAGHQGWRFEVLESKGTELGGIKSATALVSGTGVFGQLRWESGVHRATMVPENDKFGRMQTGTAVVVALPEVSEIDVQLDESDLRIETCRASGKGGQHVNTTDSAVRVVHIPTGITASCQNERSQGQNKAQALKVLRAKLHELEEQKQASKLSAQRKAAAGLANTNERIRSYNYQDGRVTDHRVGLSIQVDVGRFMGDGERLLEVIRAVKLQYQQEQLQQLLQEPQSD